MKTLLKMWSAWKCFEFTHSVDDLEKDTHLHMLKSAIEKVNDYLFSFQIFDSDDVVFIWLAFPSQQRETETERDVLQNVKVFAKWIYSFKWIKFTRVTYMNTVSTIENTKKKTKIIKNNRHGNNTLIRLLWNSIFICNIKWANFSTV